MCYFPLLLNLLLSQVYSLNYAVGLYTYYTLVLWRLVAERSRALDSSSGVSDQQHVGSSPGCVTCALNQDTYCFLLLIGHKVLSLMCWVLHVKEPSTQR